MADGNFRDEYHCYDKEHPRRSTRDRSVVKRYQDELIHNPYFANSRRARSTVRSVPRDNNVFTRSVATRSNAFTRSVNTIPTKGNALQTITFANGLIRAPVTGEIRVLSSFVSRACQNELYLLEQIRDKIADYEGRTFFTSVLLKLERNVHPTPLTHKNKYVKIFGTKNMCDISLYAVYFWKQTFEIIQRDRDLSRVVSNVIDKKWQREIYRSFDKKTDNLRKDFNDYIDKLHLTGDSRNHFFSKKQNSIF